MTTFNNHGRLFRTATFLFLFLTFFVAVLPAFRNEAMNTPLEQSHILTPSEEAGRQLYISNGCVGCHSQQVRDVEIDRVWGSRPGIAADYALSRRTSVWQNAGTLMGTERTGPDLTNIGVRQPSAEWHFAHLFNPRIVVPQSIMAPYPWLFEIKERAKANDVRVSIPQAFMQGKTGVVIATRDAINLVAYIKSLKQVKLPDGTPDPTFLYAKEATEAGKPAKDGKMDGKILYSVNCQSCHQSNGEGLKGAFPALKGSPIVLNDNPETMVDIIMNGYNPREEYGVMPAVGTNSNLSAEQVTAIMNHEKSSWGNNAKPVTVSQISKIMAFLKSQKPKP
ncbi:cytochrome c [Pedobacter suwonensis]|uniref:cytochrome c n=1 Tax=Pedobacter suwonensis TaxID=332999 RepID=UPI0036A2B08E